MNFSKQSVTFGVIGMIIGATVVSLAFYFFPANKKYAEEKFRDMVWQENKNTIKPAQEKVLSIVTNKPTSTSLSIEVYKKWAIPENQKVLVEQFNKVDTVAVEYPEYASGDLLSTLIVDGKNLYSYNDGKLNLAVYTREYLINLERDFAQYTQANKNGDFYAAYIAHLSDGIDVASGQVGQIYSNKGIALIRVDGKVYELENPPRIFNQSATGAGVYSCQASLKNKEILWICFEGFAVDEKDGVAGSQMSETRYSLTGKKLGTREYVE